MQNPKTHRSLIGFLLLIILALFIPLFAADDSETFCRDLLRKMTLEEKIGQMRQAHLPWTPAGRPGFNNQIRDGRVGSILNAGDRSDIAKLQKIAVEESRLGIPIIFARDVIHGFKTVMPIPLGLSATWDPGLIRKTSEVAAAEAAYTGIHWTFAPMMDITRDARWGRIAECLGEDPYLAAILADAMVRGFQGDDPEDLTDPRRIAACAKHFVGYGAAEGGRDYNTTHISENELRNVYLRPFEKVVKSANVATVMTAFNDLNGIPASGNKWILRHILKNEFDFNGMVVSDWASMDQMVEHGFCEDNREVALKSALAGVDMEMAGPVYDDHLADLVRAGEVPETLIDDAVLRVLKLKKKLGLFDDPYRKWPENSTDPTLSDDHRRVAYQAALRSFVLLKNKKNSLPLDFNDISSVFVAGPLANAPDDQNGTWVPDGRGEDTVTPLQYLKEFAEIHRNNGRDLEINYFKGLNDTRTSQNINERKIKKMAKDSDVTLLFLGEDQGLSGEAKSRSFLDLPGSQQDLFNVVRKHSRKLVVIIMAGRPLTFPRVLDQADAVIYAWHPGTMGGPAIIDLIAGREIPSGRLTLSFPRTVGQIPIYYNEKSTGRPANKNRVRKETLGTPEDPQGYVSDYLDVPITPQFPFGYGLHYGKVKYSGLNISSDRMTDSITVSVNIKNSGNYPVIETAQLYIRDIAASVTRPVRELKSYRQISLQPGQEQTVKFTLTRNMLSFYDINSNWTAEPGKFHVCIAPDALSGKPLTFHLTK